MKRQCNKKRQCNNLSAKAKWSFALMLGAVAFISVQACYAQNSSLDVGEITDAIDDASQDASDDVAEQLDALKDALNADSSSSNMSTSELLEEDQPETEYRVKDNRGVFMGSTKPKRVFNNVGRFRNCNP